MLAIASIADVDAVEFAVHSVLIELAINDAARNSVVNLLRHT